MRYTRLPTWSCFLGAWGVLAILLCAGVGAATAPGGAAAEEPDPQPRLVLPDESAYTPSVLDGGGIVTVMPQAVRAGQPCTLTFTYAVGERGIHEGGGVLCYVTQYWHWAPPQNISPRGPGFCTVTCSKPDVQLAVEVNPRDKTILARLEKGTLKEGDRLTFVYGDTSGGRFPEAQGTADHYAEHRERFFFKVDGDGDGWFHPVSRQASFDVLAGDAARFVAYGPSRISVAEPFELRISALDSANNLAETFTGEVKLSFDDELIDAPTSALFTPADRGSISVSATAKRSGVARLLVNDPTGRLAEARSNVLVFHDTGRQAYRLYWADLQIHGNLSDGTGTPDDIYRYARAVARLDAAALTEHDHWGYLPLDENEAEWNHCLQASARFNDPGRFVTFPAYEWTNWTFGHQHVLFLREQDAVVRAWNDSRFDHPLKLWKALGGADCLTIPHHTGGGPIPTCWKYHDPVHQPVVEIVSIHGVSERMDHPGRIYNPQESGMAQSALARGYRLGFVGGGDTHDGHPGIGSPGMPPPGLAGIYAADLTRASILSAIRARRVYATNGCRAILRFHSGNVLMGGVIRLRAPDEARSFQITVVGDAPLALITLVKNNRDVVVFKGEGIIAGHRWEDTAPARSGDYYYARIAQVDGGWIWSSPIWVEVE